MTDKIYNRYLLTLLPVLLAFNYSDRAALALVLQDLKVEMQLSDLQLGIMTGIAFSAFYAAAGIPIARWADRGNRVTIIGISTIISALAIAFCGFASTFTQLILVRLLIALGEAGNVPPAHSLLADAFPRSKRARAVAIYKLGGPLSLFIGYFIIGWVNELYGWRAAFMALGLPGVAFGLLAWMTLREPRVRAHAGNARPQIDEAQKDGGQADASQASLLEVFGYLLHSHAYRHLLLAYSVMIFAGAGLGQWTPTFLIRSFGMTTGELGTWLTVAACIGGGAGTLAGGFLAARYAENREGTQLKFVALTAVVVMSLNIVKFNAPSIYVIFGIMSVATTIGALSIGPIFSILQSLVPPNMRAMAIAILFFSANLIGLGFGPVLVGALSEAMNARFGTESLRYALIASCPIYIWCAWHFVLASRTVERDIAAAERQQ